MFDLVKLMRVDKDYEIGANFGDSCKRVKLMKLVKISEIDEHHAFL